MESSYVVNVKTKVGTIITVRGADATEFESNINALVGNGVNNSIAAMEELFLGVQPSNSGINTVVAALGGTVISETTFAPVVPPVGNTTITAGTASRSCIHGNMTKREGEGPYGHYKAFMCPTEKGTVGQCKAIYLKPNDPDYATF